MPRSESSTSIESGAPPLEIHSKFLGIWAPATCFCFCRRLSLYTGMAAMTIAGMVLSSLSAVKGLVAIALGYWFGIFGILLSMIEIAFFWMGNRGAADLNVRKVRIFFYFGVTFAIVSLIRALITPKVLENETIARVIAAFIFFVHFYCIYMVWSFLKRLEAKDLETLRTGTRRELNSESEIVPGRVMTTEGIDNLRHTHTAIQLTNVRIDETQNSESSRGIVHGHPKLSGDQFGKLSYFPAGKVKQ